MFSLSINLHDLKNISEEYFINAWQFDLIVIIARSLNTKRLDKTEISYHWLTYLALIHLILEYDNFHAFVIECPSI